MGGPFFVIRCGPRLERARAQREKRAGGTFWCPCACRGAAAPRARLVACGRVIERARETRLKFSLHTFPSLRWAGVQTTKHVGSHKRKETSERMSLFFWCGDFVARKPRPPAAALDMAPTPGQKRRRQKPSPFLLVNSQVKNPPIYGTPLSGGPSIASSWSPSGILKSSSASSPKKPFQPPSIIKASSTTISSWPSISSRW